MLEAMLGEEGKLSRQLAQAEREHEAGLAATDTQLEVRPVRSSFALRRLFHPRPLLKPALRWRAQECRKLKQRLLELQKAQESGKQVRGRKHSSWRAPCSCSHMRGWRRWCARELVVRSCPCSVAPVP